MYRVFSMADWDDITARQLAYYRARAPEYDAWWQKSGGYQLDDDNSARWQQDLRQVEQALDRFRPYGTVLELACGTGWWTKYLAQFDVSLTCVDGSPEVVEINKVRIADADLIMPDYVIADLFNWQPSQRFDLVFFSFWLSHVPEIHFDAFWSMVRHALKPDGRVFFIDSHPDEGRSGSYNRRLGTNGLEDRDLKNGQSYQIVKHYHSPGTLSERLSRAGWKLNCSTTQKFFLYGKASRQ